MQSNREHVRAVRMGPMSLLRQLKTIFSIHECSVSKEWDFQSKEGPCVFSQVTSQHMRKGARRTQNTDEPPSNVNQIPTF